MASPKKSPKPSGPDKASVHRALLEQLRTLVTKMAGLARDTASAVTHEDNRSEGDKDMRSTEQSYIARGQAMRTEELAEALQRAESFEPPAYGEDRPIAAGALVGVQVEDSAELRWLYVLGWAGGTELTVDGCTVMVITPSSPVGRHLIGKQVGDAFELAQAGKTREWVIEVVR